MGYPTDLTDKQWELIEPIFKSAVGSYGNRAVWNKRILMDAVLYLNRTGCQWNMLPNDFPPYTTVSSFFHRAKDKGVWELINKVLVEHDRTQNGKESEPTYGLVDSQSVKTVSASEERGIDGGKKIKGRKRHIVTDTNGNLPYVEVHAANIHDTKAGGDCFSFCLR